MSAGIRWAVLIGGVASVAVLSRAPVRRSELRGPLVLPSAQLLRALFAAQSQMVADYYWIRTTEAMGGSLTPEDHLDVYRYGSLVVDLDPDFRYVYAFVGGGIPTKAGMAKEWFNVRESTEIMERGIARFPRYVMLRILLAYNYSWYHRDYRRAAQIIAETAKLPDAPPYLTALATRLMAAGGDIDAALAIAMDVAESAPDPLTREKMTRRVLELRLEDLLRQVDQRIAAFREAEGHPPRDIAELRSRGYLPGEPVDPLGGEIIIGPDGRAYSTVWMDRMQIHSVEEDVERHQEFLRLREAERAKQSPPPPPQEAPK
jgi:hypothetical protein